MPISQEEEFQLFLADCRSRQRHPRAPQAIAEVLSHLMSRRGYAKLQQAAAWEEAWREVVGDRLAKDSRLGARRRRVVDVFVRNSVLLQELSFDKHRLLRQLRAALPQEEIRDLRFRIGEID